MSRLVPRTPQVISPSPDAPELDDRTDSYFEPIKTRSSARKPLQPSRIDEIDGDSDVDARARSRSRSRDAKMRRRRMSGLSSTDSKSTGSSVASSKNNYKTDATSNGAIAGHLSPYEAGKQYLQRLSRSPSPLGLIPIHREWRSFVHRHEIPRKFLHVSIGFLTLWLYSHGYQTSSIHPVLLTFLVPIALTDLLRHNWPRFNRFYIGVLGALMRESEAHDKYNGVIWYLLGTWISMRFFPKDIGVISILLLSWCDTAASTIGRAYGRYTPQIRRGKSLAGSLAAFVVGVGTALVFWGWIAPRYEALGIADNTGPNAFGFGGQLNVPDMVSTWFGTYTTPISGALALGVVSLWAGFVASTSEAIDLFGWDDNVTIPVLSGLGFWGFLRLFGAA